MAEWAKTTDQVIDNGFGGSREGRGILGIVIHHVAGSDGLDYVANKNSRNSHPTYHIARSGKATGVVHPDRQPHSTAHEIDNYAITVEIDNKSSGGNWPITEESFQTLVQIILDHEAQSERNGFALNIPGKTQKEFFIAWHSQYRATACPGPYIVSRLAELVETLNKLKGSNPAPSTPAPTPAPTPSPTPPQKSTNELAQEVLDGKWGNGEERKNRLGSRYSSVQAEVNRILREGNAKPKPSAPNPNRISQLADAVLRGEYGNGDERKRRLGADYAAVQAEVNRKLSGKTSTPSAPSNNAARISKLADAVLRGDYGNGDERKRRLGKDYKAVQAEVNRRLK